MDLNLGSNITNKEQMKNNYNNHTNNSVIFGVKKLVIFFISLANSWLLSALLFFDPMLINKFVCPHEP